MFRSRVARLVTALVLATGVVSGSVQSTQPAQAAAPDAPAGLSPGGDVTVDSVVLAWDRPPGATKFDVQVSSSASFESTLASVTGTVNTRYVPTVQLPGGTLWWRVRASNGTEQSGWVTESFRHDPSPAPVPIRPTAGTVIQPPVDSPRFAWQPVAGASKYTLQVGTDPEFVDPALITESTSTTTAVVLTGYQPAGTYYWRVSAGLGTGIATSWSTPIAYQVAGLPAARLTAPADNFDAPVRDVVLDWEPVPGAATYQLQIGTDNGFLSLVHSRSGVTGTRYSPPDNLLSDEYFWRVRPVDASGVAAPWPDTPWRFRKAWLDQPTLVYPRGDVTADVPFFYQWEALERASEYTVVLYDADGSQVCSVSSVHTTVANQCRPTAAGDYYWKVRGTDGGSGVRPVTDLIGQDPVAFHYEPAAPITPAPVASLSVDLVTGQAASMSGTDAYGIGGPRDACTATLPATCVDLRQTPVLTWDPVPGATSYKVTFARDREMTNLISISGSSVTDPIWTPLMSTLADSQAGSAYFWEVQPCGTGGCAPLMHASTSFAKKSVAPILLTPANGDVVEDDVTLSWTSELAALRDPSAATGSSLTRPASTEAKSYVVETSVDPSFASIIESQTVDQTTFTSFANTYPEGPVYWRVRSVDGGGNPTVWSATGTFVKRSDAPTLLTPADGATLGADYALTWEPLPFAASYDVEVYAGTTKVAGATSWKHTSWAPSEPYPASADGYTWRVRRVDAKSRKGEWSELRSFGVADLVPSTILPAAGSVVPPSASLFMWEPDARATSYRFERRKPGTTSLVENKTTTATAWAPTAAIAGGSWEWRVVALDAKGASRGASPWRAFTVVDPPAVVTPVTISGSGEVGTDLRLSAPTFDPVVSRTTYQWYRGTSAISGATGETYAVVAADLGKAITVRATGTVDGYLPATSTSNPITASTGDAVVAIYAPSITGTPTVGETLTVTPGDWPEEPHLTYQWFRDGVEIAGARASTYRPVAADAGRLLHVVETATVTGREPGTATSAPVRVAKLPSSTTVTLGATMATVKQRVSAWVSVSVSGLAPGGSVKVYDGSKRLSTTKLGTSSAVTVTLPRLAEGKHRIKAVYGGSAVAKPSTSARTTLTITRR